MMSVQDTLTSPGPKGSRAMKKSGSLVCFQSRLQKVKFYGDTATQGQTKGQFSSRTFAALKINIASPLKIGTILRTFVWSCRGQK